MGEFTSGFFMGNAATNGRVLVVDDEADVRKVVRMTLQKAGYDVLEAENGEKAIEAINAGENRLLLDILICDIRTDLPRYLVWRHGELVEEPTDVTHVWRDDLVSFAIGCSFSFEEALIEDGIEVRHIACGSNVPMYRTSIACVPAGVFHGPLVVSMRPLRPADAIRAVQITSRFPSVHGAPVHLGMPEQIGIKDIDKPDYGDAVPIGADELPVFWACGVTPQAAIAAVKPEFCITHAPGSMLITDLRNTKLAAF